MLVDDTKNGCLADLEIGGLLQNLTNRYLLITLSPYKKRLGIFAEYATPLRDKFHERLDCQVKKGVC